MKKKPPDVPEDYKKITDRAVRELESAANKAMWVVEMLGNDSFHMATEKYKIVITKKKVPKGKDITSYK
ncbi:hypothetical protein LCGC14_1833070 [marine sediment metagenome]|uniref:Uncharacterized protein n=1 Tax=marine sediment metagenome TaxID=412755 RepID=A0A0F9GFE4_9ZZZZ